MRSKKAVSRAATNDRSGGGVDLARLALRGVIGTTMIAHGVKHGRSLEGTAGWFGSIGFREPMLQARASAVVEVASGTALVLGAATPAAASAVVGTMAVAARSVHAANGFFITGEGYEYVLALATSSVALAALGPGPVSVDAHVGPLARVEGARVGLGALAVGLGAAAVQLAVFWRRPAA